MEFRVVDFEKVTHHYKLYQDGISNIEDYKNGILKRVDPIRKEMQTIITASQNGIVVDSMSEQQRMQRFQSLQQDLVSIDKEAKIVITEMRDSLNKEVYAELESIVNNWSKSNEIDIVIGKMEVVYVVDKYDSTEIILDILKSKNLFVVEEETVEYKGDLERAEKKNKSESIIIKEEN